MTLCTCFTVKRQVCQVNSCQNGGSCVQDLDTIHCLCSDGFRGRLCEGMISFFVDFCSSSNEKVSCRKYKKAVYLFPRSYFQFSVETSSINTKLILAE